MNYGIDAGMLYHMRSNKKITVHIPESLLRKAQVSTGTGVTDTIRKGLELLAAAEASRKLRQFRGKVRFSINLRELREDRK